MIEVDLQQELTGLVNEWQGKENQRVPADVVSHMFRVHNRIFPQSPEYSQGCAGCRQRVWNKLKTYYHENKANFEQHNKEN